MKYTLLLVVIVWVAGRSALVPHTINRIDWEALLQAFVDSCRAGWSGVLGELAYTQHFDFSLIGANLRHHTKQTATVYDHAKLELKKKVSICYDGYKPLHHNPYRHTHADSLIGRLA